jgi:hypothetical protein
MLRQIEVAMGQNSANSLAGICLSPPIEGRAHSVLQQNIEALGAKEIERPFAKPD